MVKVKSQTVTVLLQNEVLHAVHSHSQVHVARVYGVQCTYACVNREGYNDIHDIHVYVQWMLLQVLQTV